LSQPPAASRSVPVGVELRDLSVVAGQRELLKGLSIALPAGRISVIVGPSGVGKSILLRIIAGLIRNRYDGVRMRGEVLIGGEPARPGMAGVVFQSFALFDELSPPDNIEFARRCGQGASTVSAREWLERLGIPEDVPMTRR
jgi:ABC-type transporter Mla maintaining outer membrane lipid asymmetry ATPase subunit MlaF